MKGSLKPQVGDYVEVVQRHGGSIEVGDQGIVVGIGEVISKGTYGVIFPTTNDLCRDDDHPWLCGAEYIKVIYRPRTGKVNVQS